MIIVREVNETLEQFKSRLIASIACGELDAETAFDAYEEAYLRE